MKHIDRDYLHKDARVLFTDGLKIDETDRHNTPVVRKTLCLPRTIHAIIREVVFRNETTLKKFLEDSLTEMLNDDNTECRKYDFSSCAHPTVNLPKDVYKEVRKQAHRVKTPERTFVTEALVRHIRHYYLGRYSDIPGIQEL